MDIWIISILTALIYISAGYILSRFLKRNDFMDVLWGPGFALIAGVCLRWTNNFNASKIILLVLVALWAIRLSAHIFIKNRGKAEDFRYQNWRKSWGKTEWWRSFLQIYLLQGLFMLLIALPIIAFMNTSEFNDQASILSSPLGNVNTQVIGLAIIILGLIFESIADFQKSRFKKAHPHGLMKSGLWKYSRHPNYFGEAVFWWGIALFSWSEVSLIYGLISAVVITLLLRFVSGVPMLEKAKEGNQEYEQYKKETPVFVPFLKP